MKMGQELERRLDQNKYELYEVLVELREWLQSEDVRVLGKGLTEQMGMPKTMERVDKVLSKIEDGKDNG